jgi:hypothetical protein
MTMRIITCTGTAQPAHPDVRATDRRTSAEVPGWLQRLLLGFSFGADATAHTQAWRFRGDEFDAVAPISRAVDSQALSS